MATHATHIILADKVYDELFSNSNKRDFFLGTILPDIRYIDQDVPKETTHTYDITLDEVLEIKNDFDKGVAFHSLVDRVRDNFYISRGVYTWAGDEVFITALKFFEDEYLYNKVRSWPEYCGFCDHVPYEQRPDIKQESLQLRYETIKTSMLKQPDVASRTVCMETLGAEPKQIKEINIAIAKLQGDKKLLSLIDELYDTFGSLI